jgi:hypothetical protein
MAKAEITNKMIFVSSGIETVAQELHISTTEAYKRMKDIHFIDGFIISCYDALHTQSREYVTELLLYTILLLCYTLSETDTLLMI